MADIGVLCLFFVQPNSPTLDSEEIELGKLESAMVIGDRAAAELLAEQELRRMSEESNLTYSPVARLLHRPLLLQNCATLPKHDF